MTILDKQSLMLSICKSDAISLTERNNLVDLYFANDHTDSAIESQYQCKSSYPDASMKQEMWGKIMDPSSTLSLNLKEAIMRSFHQWDQTEITKPYTEIFLTNLFEVYQKNSFKYFKKFFFS